MMRRVSLLAAVVMVAGLAGCGLKEQSGDLVAGKQAFVERCGACHTLQRAGTTGVSGPNLDEAFRAARRDGLGETTIEGVVHQQILHPVESSQVDPKTGEASPGMPAKIVTGDAARNVAAYVAFVAAKPGEDAGALADIGARQAEGTARAADGVLEIPADPSGALAYEFANAEAEAGAVTLRSENASAIPHNIALEGGGVDEQGPVVQDGGVSEVQAELDAGEYTFYCSVPGHRQGGMEGTLTVQ
jgi:plastocyanin